MSRPPAEGEAARQRYRLPRSARIRSGGEIRRLFREGRRFRTGPLEVFIAASPGALPRFGLVVPRHGRPIVQRNRLRRRLRELARLEILPRLREEGRPLDLLVRTRPHAYSASYAELRSALISLTERLCSDVSHSD